MVLQNSSEGTGEVAEYEAPTLTKFGTIEEWTLGAMDTISISLVL